MFQVASGIVGLVAVLVLTLGLSVWKASKREKKERTPSPSGRAFA
jgi:hypothetical protein